MIITFMADLCCEDLLIGGNGIAYIFTGAWGKDTILDSDGQGKLSINGELLSTTKATGKRGSWTAKLGGEFVGLSIFDDASSSTGQKLGISNADGSSTITINNFDAAAAKTSTGYLGIKLDTTAKVALVENISSNVWQDYDFNASSLNGKSSNIIEGTGKTFTVFLNAAAKAGDTIKLALAGSAIKSVAGHVRKQGFAATFCSEKRLKKCSKRLLRVGLQNSQQQLIAANETLIRSAA